MWSHCCSGLQARAGAYIASQTIKKLTDINPYLLGTMARGAANCSFWEQLLAQQRRIYKLQNKERISVAAASKPLTTPVYQCKGMRLPTGTTIMAGISDPLSSTTWTVKEAGSQGPPSL